MPKTEIRPTNQVSKSKNLIVLEIAYRVYSEEGIVRSQLEFSTSVLGKGPSYLSCMKARCRTPTRAMLERLLRHTRLFLFSCKRNPHLGKPHAHHLNKAHRRLEALANTIEEELFLKWALAFDVDAALHQPT